MSRATCLQSEPANVSTAKTHSLPIFHNKGCYRSNFSQMKAGAVLQGSVAYVKLRRKKSKKLHPVSDVALIKESLRYYFPLLPHGQSAVHADVVHCCKKVLIIQQKQTCFFSPKSHSPLRWRGRVLSLPRQRTQSLAPSQSHFTPQVSFHIKVAKEGTSREGERV